MSRADVKFMKLDGTVCLPEEAPERFTFRCVIRNKGRDPRFPVHDCGNLLIAGTTKIKRSPDGIDSVPQWDWDGDRDKPTFAPSINCGGACGWHGYLRKGRCVNTKGEDEPE